jgi:hypothetical protein
MKLDPATLAPIPAKWKAAASGGAWCCPTCCSRLAVLKTPSFPPSPFYTAEQARAIKEECEAQELKGRYLTLPDGYYFNDRQEWEKVKKIRAWRTSNESEKVAAYERQSGIAPDGYTFDDLATQNLTQIAQNYLRETESGEIDRALESEVVSISRRTMHSLNNTPGTYQKTSTQITKLPAIVHCFSCRRRVKISTISAE